MIAIPTIVYCWTTGLIETWFYFILQLWMTCVLQYQLFNFYEVKKVISNIIESTDMFRHEVIQLMATLSSQDSNAKEDFD